MQPKTMRITDQEIRIVSGLGGTGFVEVYIGPKTQQAIEARLTQERRIRDRWARAVQRSACGCFGYDMESNMPCDWPRLGGGHHAEQ